MQYYFIACCARLPRWQDRCYRASRELCSDYLFISQPVTSLQCKTAVNRPLCRYGFFCRFWIQGFFTIRR